MSHSTQPIPTREAPITSIQPGGGFCFALAAGWGRCRRAILRWCFPGYVRRMAQLRQGSCEVCPHDVIDTRDLALVRNVCGYSFPGPDRLLTSSALGLARAGLCELLVFSAFLVPAMVGLALLGMWMHPGWFMGLAVVVPLWVFIVSFFRDPHRVIPADPDALVSPADGTITHLEEVDDPDFPGKAFRVSIFLSVFNVHVNRLPRAGKITRIRYYPGEFLDARAGECPVRNEQLWIDMQDSDLACPLRIKQIAGAIARRIVCWLRIGETVARGDRLGMIKFGSRTDVLVPADRVAEVCVKVGQSVRGGSQVLLRLRR